MQQVCKYMLTFRIHEDLYNFETVAFCKRVRKKFRSMRKDMKMIQVK